MNRTSEKRVEREPRNFQWVLEVLILVTVTPALVYAVTSLHNLPSPV